MVDSPRYPGLELDQPERLDSVGAYIGAAYWFTSSTSFANPAVTIGRIFTDTFAGTAPTSVLPFLAAQLIGAGAAIALSTALFSRPGEAHNSPLN